MSRPVAMALPVPRRHFTGGADTGALALAFNAFSSLFVWVAVIAILRDLFRAPESGADNVPGAICGYLIAADAWSGLNISVYLLTPSAFAVDPGLHETMGHWHGRLASFCYYSFAQMLMLGYSDITPVRAPATTLSLFSALFGLFYTAIVISLFVGLTQGASRDRA